VARATWGNQTKKKTRFLVGVVFILSAASFGQKQMAKGQKMFTLGSVDINWPKSAGIWFVGKCTHLSHD